MTEAYTPEQFEMLKIKKMAQGFRFVGPLGVFDDMAPDKSPNTACQLNVERQAQMGNLIQVLTRIAPGISQAQFYLVVSPKK